MISKLRLIEESLIKYAELLSQVLKVDVEIFDEKLFRIIGTGNYNDQKSFSDEEEAHIIKKVIEQGIMMVIENPRFEKMCEGCPKINLCTELYEVCVPITYNKDTIGAISLVCFEESQVEHFKENYDTFIQFLNQIADLISSKVSEQIEYENSIQTAMLLDSIINHIEKGVIIFDKDMKIVRLNETGRCILTDNNLDYEDKEIEIFEMDKEYLDYSGYMLKSEASSIQLVGNEFSINMGKYRRVLVFDDPQIIKMRLTALSKSDGYYNRGEIIGKSPEMLLLMETVLKVAPSVSTVSLFGESGTGKEVLARMIHENSRVKNGPFIAINCTAIPEALLESELFGYEKGAFTGADSKGKAGKFELANNGTIFLDEIGDIPEHFQVKLLRVLEGKEVTRLGSTESKKLNIRIIVATNKNLEKMVKEGLFREDLYYRLNVIPIIIPPLRNRKGDVRVLTTYFVEHFSQLLDKKIKCIESSFWTKVENYDWPGNVRELKNTMEYVVNMMDENGAIKSSLLPEKINSGFVVASIGQLNLENMEKVLIEKALNSYGRDKESKKKVAKELGIGIATLYRKIKKYEL